MAQNISFNGIVYSVPDTGEENWGSDLTGFFVAIPQGALQKTGGLFTLTGDVNFGPNYGLLSQYLKSRGVNPGSTGLVRLIKTETIAWRNNANSGDLLLSIDGSDNLLFNGMKVILTGLIVNSDVAAGAAIARSKLASSTNYRILANDSSGVMSENAALTATHVVFVDANGQLSGEAALAISRGGTGQSTKAPAFDALSPMTTSGDTIYGGTSGTGTRLPKGSDGQVYTVVSGLPAWANLGASIAPTVQKFTSGSGTYMRPTGPTPISIRIRMSGGGAGGVGSGTVAGSVPTAGADSTFGTITAGGGAISTWTAGVGGAGGTTSGTTNGIAVTGGSGGGGGLAAAAGSYSWGGNGGANPLGGAPGTGGAGHGGSSGAANTGAGGAGGGTTGTAATFGGEGGGAGGYIDTIINNPASTYSYVVGAGGTAGGAGANGAPGGAGGSGSIVIEEYYQ